MKLLAGVAGAALASLVILLNGYFTTTWWSERNEARREVARLEDKIDAMTFKEVGKPDTSVFPGIGLTIECRTFGEHSDGTPINLDKQPRVGDTYIRKCVGRKFESTDVGLIG